MRPLDLISVPGHATILNLLPLSDTDESEICARLGVDSCTFVTGNEIRERGARRGLRHLRKIHRDAGSTVFAVNSLDWAFQTQRTGLYGLACLVPARRRVALDSTGRVIALTWGGLLFREIPLAISQAIAGKRLVTSTTARVQDLLEKGPEHRAINQGDVKKIAYMRTDLWYAVKAGGSVGHIAGVINGFVKHGVEVNLLSWDKPPLLDGSVEFTGIRPSDFFNNERELALLSYNSKLIERGVNALWQDCPDVIYARYSLDCYAPVPIAQQLGIPLILEYNGSEVWIEQHWGRGLKYQEVARKIEDLVTRSADLITVVSKPLKDELIGRGIEKKRVIVNPNSVDAERFDPERYPPDEIKKLREELGIPEGTRVAGFIGTFSQWHGVEVLAEAIPMALNNYPRLHFLLIGSGPLFDKIRERLRIADKLNNVTLTGLIPQDQAPRYLMCSDFFLSPHVPNPDGTPFFGSPTKLFEYMALGKGIIASDLDQIGEIIKDGETGLLIPPGNSAALVEAIGRFCDDPELANRLGIIAREEALEHHTWQAHVGRILDALHRL